jgi:hypothetical protein
MTQLLIAKLYSLAFMNDSLRNHKIGLNSSI